MTAKRAIRAVWLAVLSFWAGVGASAADVARYGRFETAFTSERDYGNGLHDVQVRVEFSGPGGARREVEAFWDGERTWRVRFSPEIEGEWSYLTTATDAANKGLHGQRGGFRCVPYRGGNALYRHGPLRVAAAKTHLEHADGTAFFWLGDTAWTGPLLSGPEEWRRYLADRQAKRFTVVQFIGTQYVAAAGDAQGRQAYTEKEKIVLDPYFFRRLDQRVDAINEAGLIAAPAFAWAAQYMLAARQFNPGAWLPDDQMIAFGRYFVARYGAHQVVWLFAGDYDYRPAEVAARWRRLGAAIFGDAPHRLVTVHPAPRILAKEEFGREPWLSFVGYQSGHHNGDGLITWINKTGPAREWSIEPIKPIINLEPIYEAHMNFSAKRLATPLDVRQASWWSVLATPIAGVTYGAHGVWSWETQPAAPLNHVTTGVARPWHEAIAHPGSTHLMHLRAILEAVPWTRLRPAPKSLILQPGDKGIQKFVAAALADDGRVAVLYFPGSASATSVDLSVCSSPVAARWIDPTNGRAQRAARDVLPNQGAHLFTPPGKNAGGDEDWVLVLEAKSKR